MKTNTNFKNWPREAQDRLIADIAGAPKPRTITFDPVHILDLIQAQEHRGALDAEDGLEQRRRGQ